MENKLYQFECQRNGTLFYYQACSLYTAQMMVRQCPQCGSTRVESTGREYKAINEQKPVRKVA